jgi:hypothetical protein
VTEVAKFTDTAGAEWELVISFGAAVRLKRDAGFDLDQVGEATGESLVKAIYGHPHTFEAVLWELLRERVEAAGLTRETWQDRLTPAVLDLAADALWEAVTDFIHRRRAPAIKAMLPALLGRMDAAVSAAAAAGLGSALRSSGGASPASSDSTPAG